MELEGGKSGQNLREVMKTRNEDSQSIREMFIKYLIEHVFSFPRISHFQGSMRSMTSWPKTWAPEAALERKS